MTTPIPSNYDFNDPAVRQMVEQNHCPAEEVIRNNRQATVYLLCEQDRESWPCSIITAYREWQAAQV